MRTLIETAEPGRPPALALALLSGTYSTPEDFVRAGFPEAVRAHGIDAEIVMAQVRASDFSDGSIVRQIRDDVVQPAIERGARRVWLAGVSLGGLAALSFAARHGDALEGIVLISPYPAMRPQLRDLDDVREAWSWLARSRSQRVPVHCYYATGDRFVSGQRRMAAVLDADRVREMPGGHDWESWGRLWNEFLATSGKALQ
jgi:pimeloyl-ACP methyl ester carboxylesterase